MVNGINRGFLCFEPDLRQCSPPKVLKVDNFETRERRSLLSRNANSNKILNKKRENRLDRMVQHNSLTPSGLVNGSKYLNVNDRVLK
ncbi:hypothetical protein CMI42_02275 [Candidatus Pacearchaeota archaeon]|nr:hypothetical protein [Candidatus Pacearchaeota archaeon]